MSTWMSIGFDPDQMDAVTEPRAQVAMGGARGEVALPQAGGLDQATRWIAGALKHLAARHRNPAAPDWTP